jgi:CO/xanthine dehydrogenase FAD-binding subunit
LKPGEIVTELVIPKIRPYTGCGYYKLSPRKSLDLAVVGVAAMIRTNPAISRCLEARIVLGAVAPTAIRAKKAEFILTGANLNESLIEQAADAAAGECKPIDDIRSSAWYRKKMVAVATKRAIALAIAQIRRITNDDLRMTN